MKLLQFAFLSLTMVVSVTSSTLSACVWNNATRSCAWHISQPLAALADSNPVDLGTLNAKGRALILGGYALDVCVQQQSESGCLSASVNGTSVCQWRADAGNSPIAFLASQPTKCMPMDSIMAEYLGLTAPSKCPEEATLGVCTSDYKCRYDDHIDHAHCLVDMMYVQKALGGVTNPLAVAANKAQHLCAPETVWTSFEANRPQPLSQLECVQKGTFQAPEGLTTRLAMAAGLVEAAPASPPSSNPPRPNPSPSPTTKDNSNGKAVTVADCQLLAPSVCVPTLLSLANVAPGNMKSNPARILMSAVSSAVTCTFNHSLPADAAVQQQCSQTALDSIPNLLTDVFNPSCAKLSETTCTSWPGCTLKPHGNHMDCTQGMFYAFEYLGGGERSLHIQDKADACRAAVASCGESTITITSDMMTAWNTAVALSPPDLLEEDDHEHEHEHDHDHDGRKFGEETQTLRVASVFIILVAGFVGCALPFVFKGCLATGTLAYRLVQSASAGIIISLALIHIATHAMIEMEGLDKGESGVEHDHQHRRRSLLGTALTFTRRHLLQHEDHDHAEATDGDGFTYESHHHPYPIGMAVVVFGFLLMILFEHLASVIHRSQSEQASLGPSCKAHRRGVHIQHRPQLPDMNSSGHLESQHDSVEKGKALELSESGPDSPTSTTTSQRSRLILALLFEVGCVAHSFIIGMSLGVSLTFEDIRPLLVALCFHQLLEGISLGTVLLYSGLHLFKQLSLIVVYAITCPLGVGVGIAIAYSYNPHSMTARAVQGTFNGVAAGMLLYLGMALVLADLWLEEYKRPLHRVLSFAVLCIGVGVMAVIAMWA